MKYNVENSDLYDIRVIDNVLYIKLEGYYTSDMDGLIDKVR